MVGIVPLGRALPQSMVSRLKNGAGAFVLQLHKLTLYYCNYGGSSKHVREYLQTKLPDVAQQNPSVLFVAQQRPGKHPYIKGEYLNGRERTIGVKNLPIEELHKRIMLLRGMTGAKLTKIRKPVHSDTPSINGYWEPFTDPRVKP